MYWLIFLFSLSKSSRFDCMGSKCSSCSSGYLFSYTCLNLCPTGYLQNVSCLETDNLGLFSINFLSFTSVVASSIEPFKHPLDLPFNDQMKLSPIPTKERGFYFANTSKLVSDTSWVLSPNFQITMMIKIYTDGTIFLVTDNNTSFVSIKAHAGQILATWCLNSTTIQNESIQQNLTTINYTHTNWYSINFLAQQTEKLFTISSSSFSISLQNYEFLGQIPNLFFYIGDINTGSSFSGMITTLIAYNSLNLFYQNLRFPYTLGFDCDYDYYYDISVGCQLCGNNCAKWPWCTANDCSICYSSNCSECTGYGYNDCIACNNGGQAPGCYLGKNCASGASTLNCSVCLTGYILINGLCTFPPYKYDSKNLLMPVIDLKFDSFTQFYGGIFQSGNNASSWAPFNNPENDDPFPIKNRGLYFNQGSYLKSNQCLNLNTEFTIAYWYYPSNFGYIVAAYEIELYSFNNGWLNLKSYQDDYYETIPFFYMNSYNWQFFAIAINIINNSTQAILHYNNQIVYIYNFDSGYFFYSINSSLFYIGNYYLGLRSKTFIYSITIWQTGILDISNYYNICGNGLAGSCLWNCNLTQYYNYYEGVCNKCNSSCSHGCAIAGTCNQCLSPDCESCSNYNTVCESTLQNPCFEGLIFTSGNHCCNSECLDCFGIYNYNCLSCNSSSFLLSTICVTACPIGFIPIIGSCAMTINPFLSITLDNLQDMVIDSQSGISFNTGNSTGFYTNSTIYDPIPVYQRGYYFSNTSFMTSTDFTMSYNFTIIFYIKQLIGGFY